jgi:symplekin
VRAADDDDDYEPEYQPMDIPPEAVAQAEAVSAEVAGLPPDLVALGPFVLPQPPPLSKNEAAELGKGTVERVFGMVATLDQSSKTPKDISQKLGFGRLAASSFDRDSWVTLLTRLATRAPAGLESDEAGELTKVENGHRSGPIVSSKPQVLAERIRGMLYRYILEDFRIRINVAISWMNEEWYNDRIQLKHVLSENGGNLDRVAVPRHYDRWVIRLLEGILPYLDARDKVLIRFLSEIPDLSEALIERVKSLANDPERVGLCVQALQ